MEDFIGLTFIQDIILQYKSTQRFFTFVRFFFTDIDFDVNLKEIDVHRTARIFPPSFLQAAYQSITNLPYLKMYLKYFFSSDSLAQKVWSCIKESTYVSFYNFNEGGIKHSCGSSGFMSVT